MHTHAMFVNVFTKLRTVAVPELAMQLLSYSHSCSSIDGLNTSQYNCIHTHIKLIASCILLLPCSVILFFIFKISQNVAHVLLISQRNNYVCRHVCRHVMLQNLIIHVIISFHSSCILWLTRHVKTDWLASHVHNLFNVYYEHKMSIQLCIQLDQLFQSCI